MPLVVVAYTQGFFILLCYNVFICVFIVEYDVLKNFSFNYLSYNTVPLGEFYNYFRQLYVVN